MATITSMWHLMNIDELSVTIEDDIYTLTAPDGSTLVLESCQNSYGRHQVFTTVFDISHGGQLVKMVYRNDTLRHIFTIYNNRDQRMLKLKGPYCMSGTCKFVVYNNRKEELGVIKRRGLFSKHEEHSNIKFPPDLHVQTKAAVIGAFALLVSFIIYLMLITSITTRAFLKAGSRSSSLWILPIPRVVTYLKYLYLKYKYKIQNTYFGFCN